MKMETDAVEGRWDVGRCGEQGSAAGSYGKGKTRIRKLDLNQEPGRRPEVSLRVDICSCVCELHCHRRYYAIKNTINFATYETNTPYKNRSFSFILVDAIPICRCNHRTITWMIQLPEGVNQENIAVKHCGGVRFAYADAILTPRNPQRNLTFL